MAPSSGIFFRLLLAAISGSRKECRFDFEAYQSRLRRYARFIRTFSVRRRRGRRRKFPLGHGGRDQQYLHRQYLQYLWQHVWHHHHFRLHHYYDRQYRPSLYLRYAFHLSNGWHSI